MNKPTSKENAKPVAIIVIGAGLRKMDDTIVCSIQSVHNVEKALDLSEELGTKDINLIFSGGFSLDSKIEEKQWKNILRNIIQKCMLILNLILLSIWKPNLEIVMIISDIL
jgi:hypothetical protein